MSSGPKTYAFNRTRQAFLATELSVADTHCSRFWGLMFQNASNFQKGQGLWIIPSRGVHTFAMRFPIDVVYLDKTKRVVHLHTGLKPWRVAAVKMEAASVLELPGDTLGASGTTIGDELEIVG